jgi:hypothetical protein
MANDDAQWVEDVRRWYFGGHPPEGEAADGSQGSDEMAIGYEAAQPALERCRWPDALTPGDL